MIIYNTYLNLKVIVMVDLAPLVIMIIFQNQISVIPISAFAHSFLSSSRSYKASCDKTPRFRSGGSSPRSSAS